MTVRVYAADFDADYDEIRRIRFQVFVDEQRVPEDIEMDERDAHCLHVLAQLDGSVVGTGRVDLELGGKIGRVAVAAGVRKRGVGTAIMQALHATVEAHGRDSVWCSAQVAAVPFYERLGYRVTSPPFFEAGIEHVKMEKTPLVRPQP